MHSKKLIKLKRSILHMALIGVILFITFPCAPAGADSAQVPAQQLLDRAIDTYIRSHPELIEDALKSLEVKRKDDKKAYIRQAIIEHQNELLRDVDSPVSGNVAGDVTVIEFFDYRCGYCKQTADAVTQLQQEDGAVRVVYKDYPIWGAASTFATRAALAAQVQGKHRVFHEALMASQRDLLKDEVLLIADKVGLDRKRLEADMGLPQWDRLLERNRALAELLTIAGTPGFVVGGELHPGALTLEALKRLVAKARGM